MAITIGQAMVKLAADNSQLGKDLGDAEGKTKGWASGLAGNVNKIMAGVVLGGVTAVAGSVVGIGKAVVDMAADNKTAQANLRSEFGLTADEAAEAANLARDVWADNFGESVTDVAQALGTVQQQLWNLGITSEAQIGAATRDAIALRDTYGLEVGESISTVRTLMENFGITSDEAFDFIAAGYQKGLNRSDDFIDSINEYSVQFSEAGANSLQFFSAMQTGLQGGMLGTDKAADAFKEFRVRILDGSATTSDALKLIGIDADELTTQLANGTMTVVEAWDDVKDGLRNADDEAIRMQAGVGLIGTQFEDLGWDAVDAIDLWQTGLDEISGASDELNNKYDTFGTMFEGFKRKALDSLSPLVDKFLELGNDIMPVVTQAFDRLSELAAPFVDRAAEALGSVIEIVSSFISNISEGMDPLNAFIEAIWDIAPQWLLDALVTFRDTILPTIQDLISRVADFVTFKDVAIALGIALATILVPAALSLAASLAPIILVVGLIIGAVALARKAWEENWGGIRDKLTQAWEQTIRPALTKLWEWLKIKVPEAVEKLRQFWVEVAWPKIQEVLETVWPIIKNIFEALKDFVINTLIPTLHDLYDKWTTVWWPKIQEVIETVWPKIEAIFNAIKDFIIDTLIPTIQDLYQQWTEDWWPTIQTVLENVWTVIEEIFTEIGRWINDNIVPWIEFLYEKWVDEVWPAIQSAVETVWEFIEPIWESIREWMEEKIPPILDSLGEKFGTIWDGIKKAIEPVKDLWDGFIDAVKRFWDWISSKVFDFKLNLPNLPDWAVPGSPLPIHDAWKAFYQDLDALGLRYVGTRPDLETPPNSTGPPTTNNYYLTYNGQQTESSVASDIRALELVRVF